MPYWRTPNRPQTVVNLIWGVVLAKTEGESK